MCLGERAEAAATAYACGEPTAIRKRALGNGSGNIAPRVGVAYLARRGTGAAGVGWVRPVL